MKSGVLYIYIFILYLILLQNKTASGNLYQVLKESDQLWKALVCILIFLIVALLLICTLIVIVIIIRNL